MNKPKMPRKPKMIKPKPPGNVITIVAYAWENRDTGEVEFFEHDGHNDVWETDEEATEFYEQWCHLNSTNVEILTEFAESVGVPIEDAFAVPAYEWSNGEWLEYRAIKHLSKEEFAKKRADYEAELNAYEENNKNHKKAMEQYRLDKAEWDMWQAKQKVEALKNAKDS